MHYIAELGRRKALVGALAACLAGGGLIVHALLGQAQPAPAQEDLGLLAAEGLAPPEELVDGGGAQEAGELVVYVTGAVQAPDVYRLPAEARVKDLVVAAGGLAPDADAEAINLAAPLSDGQHVLVPRLGAGPAPGAADSADSADAGGLIDLNAAGAEELDALPGVGPAIAGRIVARRDAAGPYRSVEELQDVQGIGAALYAKIAPLVTVGP